MERLMFFADGMMLEKRFILMFCTILVAITSGFLAINGHSENASMAGSAAMSLSMVL